MPRGSIAALAATAAALISCVPIKRIPTCDLGAPEPIELDAVTPDGTTARAFAEQLPGSRRGSLQWFRSAEPDLEITVPAPGATTTVDVEVSAPATSASYRPGITPLELRDTPCAGAIELAVALRVATADHGLDEHWTATATQLPGGGASFTVNLAQQPPTGTLRVVLTDPAAWGKTTFEFEMALDNNGGGSGSVSYSASREINGGIEGFTDSAAILTFEMPDAGTTTSPDAGDSG
jgi:hypothetical protein